MSVVIPLLSASPDRKARYRRFDPFLNELELLNLLGLRQLPPSLLDRLGAQGVHLSSDATPARAIEAVFGAQGEPAYS